MRRTFRVAIGISVLMGISRVAVLNPSAYNTGNRILPDAVPSHKNEALRIAPSICDNGLGTNTVLERDEVLRIIQREYIGNPSTVRFATFGQALLKEAMKKNRYLVTVQVGAMDGSSNDPLWGMFHGRKRRGTLQDYNLTHWIPMAVEPVPTNFDSLQENYRYLKVAKDLPCAKLLRGAVAYDGSSQSTTSQPQTCSFCHYNVNSTLEKCTRKPDWMKYQIGTLDCEYSRKFFGRDFEDCILQDPVPCAPIADLMEEHKLPRASVSMLQIDVEGYEAILLPNFLRASRSRNELPPVIHFEKKVMIHLDKRKNGNGTRYQDTVDVLKEFGYSLFDQGEDMLALLLESQE